MAYGKILRPGSTPQALSVEYQYWYAQQCWDTYVQSCHAAAPLATTTSAPPFLGSDGYQPADATQPHLFCRRISQFQQDAQLAAQLARDAWHQAQQEHVDQQLAAALTQESHALYRSGSLPAQQQHELLDQQMAAELAKDGSGCVSELQVCEMR